MKVDLRNFQAFILIRSGLTMANVKTLTEVIEKLGYDVKCSYRDIGDELNVTYENIRYHFRILEKLGYLTIEKRSPKKFVFHINKEKVNELFG